MLQGYRNGNQYIELRGVYVEAEKKDAREQKCQTEKGQKIQIMRSTNTLGL